ncbi:MAG: cytochrome-c oxidase [Kofleriaceae bacterium]|nr:cytochrome-c oxidase [Kofleriaceae bacterium]
MADEQAPPHEGHEAASGRPYVLALVALLLLTGLTFGMHFAPLGGALGLVVALTIATIKVGIVATIFMELRESFAATRLVAVFGVAFLLLICLGVVGDVAFR